MKHSSVLLGVVTLAVQMSGRILTPNGDGLHDRVAFTLPSSLNRLPQSRVFDARGHRVADLVVVSPTELQWDGKDFSGRSVSSGIYIIQISDEATLWSGVVAVAK